MSEQGVESTSITSSNDDNRNSEAELRLIIEKNEDYDTVKRNLELNLHIQKTEDFFLAYQCRNYDAITRLMRIFYLESLGKELRIRAGVEGRIVNPSFTFLEIFSQIFSYLRDNEKFANNPEIRDKLGKSYLINMYQTFQNMLPARLGFKMCINEECSKTIDECTLYKCSRCMCQRYCSKECQSQHWNLHKRQCIVLRNFRSSEDNIIIQFET